MIGGKRKVGGKGWRGVEDERRDLMKLAKRTVGGKGYRGVKNISQQIDFGAVEEG